MTRVLIADDHPLVRAALTTAVRRARPDARVEEAQTLAEAVDRLRADPHVSMALLDLRMPDCEGFAGLLTLRAEFPTVPVAVVSATEDADTIRKALSFGAAGYVPKSTSLDGMAEALSALLDGDEWAPPTEPSAPVDDAATRIASLTPAQLRILIGLQKGRLNKQIAYDMGVSEATVKAHMTAIFRKLGVLNRTQAVIAAQAMALEPDAA